MIYCYPDISRFGLGNKLMVWARAECFAHDHGAKILAPRFVQLPSVSAILGGVCAVGGYRTNIGNFDLRHGGYVSGIRRAWVLGAKRIINESSWSPDFKDGVVRFAGIGNGSFRKMLDHHAYICERLRLITDKRILDVVANISKDPFIGIHIRRGDFKINGLAVPDAWYVRALRRALEMSGTSIVRVFSDGHNDELRFVERAFPKCHVIIMPKAKPLQDIWALSRSEIVVGSSGSTFSMWAVMLGQMPSIWNPLNLPRSTDIYVNSAMKPDVVA